MQIELLKCKKILKVLSNIGDYSKVASRLS